MNTNNKKTNRLWGVTFFLVVLSSCLGIVLTATTDLHYIIKGLFYFCFIISSVSTLLLIIPLKTRK